MPPCATDLSREFHAGFTEDGRRNRSSFAKTMCEVCMLRRDDLTELLKNEDFRHVLSTIVHKVFLHQKYFCENACSATRVRPD